MMAALHVWNHIVAWDHATRAWIVMHRFAPLDSVMWLLSVVGRGGMLWLALGAADAVRRARRLEFLTLVLAIALAAVIADHVLKPIVDRTRPFVASPSVAVIGGKPDDPSFPSGHAACAFAGASVLATTWPAGRAVWWLFAVAIAFSRVYLGVHYPLDVIGGAVVGVAAGAAALRIATFGNARRHATA
jgi:undecaprenyl-diphosphatase